MRAERREKKKKTLYFLFPLVEILYKIYASSFVCFVLFAGTQGLGHARYLFYHSTIPTMKGEKDIPGRQNTM